MVQALTQLREKSVSVRTVLADQTLAYVTAALSLIAGLAWNDAVKALIDYLFPLTRDSVLAQFLYAILMTMVVVLLTLLLRRVFGLVKK